MIKNRQQNFLLNQQISFCSATKYNIVLSGMHSISFRLKILQQRLLLASKIFQLDFCVLSIAANLKLLSNI